VFDRLVSAAARRNVAAQPTAFLEVLNLLDEGILLLDHHCNSLWANTVFASAIRADPECDRLLTATRRLAAAVSANMESHAAVVARADVRTQVAQYAIRATRLVPDAEFMTRPFDVVVSMARVAHRSPDLQTLMRRFSLTPCEASVALLLARGMTNRDIARTLAVSAHTARHHTESVLLKLGIHTRAAVGGVVFDAVVPASPARHHPAGLHSR
jgi:DNA-binding NarL/FixJ family response regulator